MTKKININRKEKEPAYKQLVNIITEQIANGVYKAGSQLPSESMLCKQYHVSPMTVRRTIKTLSDKGIVSAIKGSGTYVKAPSLSGGTFSLENFSSIFNDKKKTKVKMLSAKIVDADEITAKKLSIKAGERTIFIRRVMLHDGDPIIYHKENLIYDPERPIVEAELEITSLHGLFVGMEETNLKSGELEIEAVVLSEDEAEVLNTIRMKPAFRIEHIFYDFEDKPVSWGRFICRGDRFKFNTRVGIDRK